MGGGGKFPFRYKGGATTHSRLLFDHKLNIKLNFFSHAVLYAQGEHGCTFVCSVYR